MPEWLTLTLGIITAIITAIIAPILIQRYAPHWLRRKTEADTEHTEATTEHTEAQTERTEVEILQGIILTLEGQYNKIIEENAALRDRCEKEANVNRVLHEQKVHAEAYLTIAEARLALYEGRTLVNNNAEGTQEANAE